MVSDDNKFDLVNGLYGMVPQQGDRQIHVPGGDHRILPGATVGMKASIIKSSAQSSSDFSVPRRHVSVSVMFNNIRLIGS